MIFGFNDKQEKVKVIPKDSVKIIQAYVNNVSALSTGQTTVSAATLAFYGIDDVTEWTIAGFSYKLEDYTWTCGGDIYNSVFYPYVTMTESKGLEFHGFNWAGNSQNINFKVVLIKTSDITG